MGYPYDDGCAETEAANMRACIEARQKANLLPVEDIDALDCESECPLHENGCPFSKDEREEWCRPAGDPILPIQDTRKLTMFAVRRAIEHGFTAARVNWNPMKVSGVASYCLSHPKIVSGEYEYRIGDRKVKVRVEVD